jgi:hypothetical protein
MKNIDNAPARVFGYLLQEEQFHVLENMRDQILLMAMLSFALTRQQEETAPMELKPSMLGQCFETFDLQLDEVLYAVERAGHVSKGAMRKH